MNTQYLGIEIGGTKLQVVLGDETGRISKRERANVDPAAGGAGIREQLTRMLPAFSEHNPAAIGVGFGGPVDWKTGQICCSHQIEGWSEFPLGKWLSDLTQIPAFVDNDANVACLGEARHGAGLPFNPVFYVTLGSGVGGGLVVDGRIYHGAKPGEAEIGHIRLDRSGTILESRCSGWAVDGRIRAAIKQHPDCLLAKLIGSSVRGEAKFLRAAVEAGDSVARQILQETAEDLAFGLSHVTHLFHPEVVILGGGLSLVGEPLGLAVERALPFCIMHAFGAGPRLELARLSEDSVPVGALTLSREIAREAT